MAGDDLEPIDLESIDIEPVDLEPGDAEAAATARRASGPRLDPERARRPGWIWVGLAAAGCAVWATVASGTHRPRPHPSTTPTTPTTAANWVTPTSLPVDRLAALESRLWSTLGDVGSGRFAVVVDGRLYLLDAVPGHAEATPVGLPYGDVRIDEQSGSSFLVSTSQQTLVSTTPVRTVTLSASDTPLKAVAPRQWWLLRDDGSIRDERGGVTRRPPVPLRIVAAVNDGFVALAPPEFRWVLWSGTTVRPLAPPGYQLLVTGPRVAVFKSGCGYNGCALEFVDLPDRTVTENRLQSVPQFAEMSPDGSRLALATTQGDVMILDTGTGGVIAEAPKASPENAALPISWTPDGRTLLVVGTDDIQIVRAVGRAHDARHHRYRRRGTARRAP